MPRQARQQQNQSHGREPPSPFNLKLRMEEFERGYLQNTLQLTQWDLEETARLLQVSPDTLQQKIHLYHLKQAQM